MAILATLVGLTAMVENRALNLQQAEQAAELLRIELVSARTESIANTHDGRWGVHIENNVIVQFQGDGYDVRDAAYDKRLEFAEDVTVSGTRDYVFERPSGLPLNNGETDFSNIGSAYRVTVNRYGAVEVAR